MRKIFAFILVMALSLSLLASCSSEKKSAGIVPGSGNEAQTEKNMNAAGVSNTIASNANLNAGGVSKNYGQIMSKIAVSRRQIQTSAGAETAAGYYQKTIGSTITSPITNSTYELKFIDDFNGTALNTNNWTVDTINYNSSEGQANIPQNIVVQNGLLNIYGKKDTVSHKRYASSGQALSDTYYTGGAINSKKKQTFKFGRLEILARLPYSQGMWPAFWTMGTLRGWPWGGEIDIMEMVGGTDEWGNKNREGQYNVGIHWCKPEATSATAYSSDHKTKGGRYDLPGRAEGAKLADAYHVIGLEWTDTKLVFYIDNIKVIEVVTTDYTMREAFFQNHFMILNLAMGSVSSSGVQSWATAPDSFTPTVWPQDFQIDWVKVWQIKN